MRGTATKAQSSFGQSRHIAPQLLELRDREDVFLAVSPALLDVLQGDVRGHPGGDRADARRHLVGIVPASGRVSPKTASSLSTCSQLVFEL